MTKSLHLIPILICVKVCLHATDKDCRAVIKPVLPFGCTQRFMLFTNNYVQLRLQKHNVCGHEKWDIRKTKTADMLDICFCVCIRQIAIWLYGKTQGNNIKSKKRKQKCDILYSQGPQKMPHFAALGAFLNNFNWFFFPQHIMYRSDFVKAIFWILILNLKQKSHYISIQNCVGSQWLQLQVLLARFLNNLSICEIPSVYPCTPLWALSKLMDVNL